LQKLVKVQQKEKQTAVKILEFGFNKSSDTKIHKISSAQSYKMHN